MSVVALTSQTLCGTWELCFKSYFKVHQKEIYKCLSRESRSKQSKKAEYKQWRCCVLFGFEIYVHATHSRHWKNAISGHFKVSKNCLRPENTGYYLPHNKIEMGTVCCHSENSFAQNLLTWIHFQLCYNLKFVKDSIRRDKKITYKIVLLL